MSYRSEALLEQWVWEFAADAVESPGVVEVLRHDGGAGADTGLVVIRMTGLPSDIFLHPVGPGDPRWEVNFGPRERDLAMSADELRALARELDRAAALCEFFEFRSEQHAARAGNAPAA